MTTFPIAAITDEFSPDLDVALRAMADVGMTGAELRTVSGRNMLDLSDEEVDRVRAAVDGAGMRVVSLASPLLKCVLPGSPALDTRVQHDVFGSPYTYEDQPRLTRRAFEIAERCGAPILRVFSYWRTVQPEACFEAVASALHELAEEGARRGIVIGLENEHACNVATGEETGRLLSRVDDESVKVVWDPANAMILGEAAYPDGYAHVPASRIAHVHAKDCHVTDHKPTWGLVGDMGVDWRGQLEALRRDGYHGWISLETHWTGPNGDKFEASVLCGRRLKSLIHNP
jgi:L-ribulose-5-phosphate 3-epimerase